MNWGLRIIILYVGFVGLIVTLVTLTMREKVDLVAADYYEKEIHYQERINSINKAAAIAEVEIEIKGEAVDIRFPAEKAAAGITGNIVFFRPSDSAKDRTVKLEVDAKGGQSVPLSSLSRGMYQVEVTWKSGGEDFFSKKMIHVP